MSVLQCLEMERASFLSGIRIELVKKLIISYYKINLKLNFTSMITLLMALRHSTSKVCRGQFGRFSQNNNLESVEMNSQIGNSSGDFGCLWIRPEK
jgi:hypothetical protein